MNLSILLGQAKSETPSKFKTSSFIRTDPDLILALYEKGREEDNSSFSYFFFFSLYTIREWIYDEYFWAIGGFDLDESLFLLRTLRLVPFTYRKIR